VMRAVMRAVMWSLIVVNTSGEPFRGVLSRGFSSGRR
jgi:hypothetical protein